jgi:hypothetical protein
MKIVSKAELLQMPKGTPFADYRNTPDMLWTTPPTMILDSICYHTETGEAFDFFYTTVDSPEFHDTGELFERCDRMADHGDSYPVDLTIQREGLYDPDMRYIVWEPEDVQRIINLLQGGDDE